MEGESKITRERVDLSPGVTLPSKPNDHPRSLWRDSNVTQSRSGYGWRFFSISYHAKTKMAAQCKQFAANFKEMNKKVSRPEWLAMEGTHQGQLFSI